MSEDSSATHECISDEVVAADVEKYGHSIMLVNGDDECPQFGYSIGFHRNLNHPEIIIFGLNHEVTAWIINELANRIRNGERCEIGREYEGLLEAYKCVFSEVPNGCYMEYFGYGMSFYEGSDFPALQLVWPDKENKWPWEIEFNHRWIWHQPLLRHWPEERVKSQWAFDEPRNLGVFTTTSVIDENHSILLVCHDDDGDWQFLCGTTDDSKHCRIVCLKDMVERDPSVKDIADLPLGWRAWRERVGAEWHREADSSEEKNLIEM